MKMFSDQFKKLCDVKKYVGLSIWLKVTKKDKQDGDLHESVYHLLCGRCTVPQKARSNIIPNACFALRYSEWSVSAEICSACASV